MKKLIMNYIVIAALQVQAVEAMNYVQSAYRRVVDTGNMLKQQAQEVKSKTDRLVQSLSCFQNRLGCSAGQMSTIDTILASISTALQPLFNVPAAIESKIQKARQFIQTKIKELQLMSQQRVGSWTPEQKAAFVSGAKKIAIAAAVIVAAVAVVAIGVAITGNQKKSFDQAIRDFNIQKDSVDYVFLTSIATKDWQSANAYLTAGIPSIPGLKAAEKLLQSDSTNKKLLGDIRLQLLSREGLSQANITQKMADIRQEFQIKVGTPDYDFVNDVVHKRIAVIQEKLRQNTVTLEALGAAQTVINEDPLYPQKNALLKDINLQIHLKSAAQDVKEARARGAQH